MCGCCWVCSGAAASDDQCSPSSHLLLTAPHVPLIRPNIPRLCHLWQCPNHAQHHRRLHRLRTQRRRESVQARHFAQRSLLGLHRFVPVHLVHFFFIFFRSTHTRNTIGIGSWCCTYIYMMAWTYTGEINAKRIRERYLQSVLRQDIAYFDTIGAGEIATRIQTDTRAFFFF